MTSQLVIENDQSTGHFQSFFFFSFFLFRTPDPKSEKNLVNQLIKKSGLKIENF